MRARDPQFGFLLGQLGATGEGAPGIEEKIQLVAAMRGHSPEASTRLDRYLVEEIARLNGGLAEVEENQEKLRALIEKLTAAPWHPATFLGPLEHSELGRAAIVLHGSSPRVVGVADDLDLESFLPGDDVLLTSEMNYLISTLAGGLPRFGETAAFDRYLPDGRIVLRVRDEEVLVRPAGALRGVELRPGDSVRFERPAGLAFEKIGRSEGRQFFLEETPRETFDDVGGLDKEIERIRRMVELHLRFPEHVRRYRLRPKRAILLYGPPGTGKTLMARALANWLATLSKTGRSRFINVKPGGLNSMWYGQTEANYREVFRVAREAGIEEPDVPVVLFFDEVDSIGAARGQSVHRIDDRVQNAFMAELNGLEERGNILVVTATNRRDSLDPALMRPGRLADLVLQVRRPGRNGAKAIFNKLLHPEVPFGSDGQGGAAAREALIESAVSRIYSPNGAPEAATLVFRDNRRRPVYPRDLISGAEISRIVQTAVECACLRDATAGEAGVRLDDVLEGVEEFFEFAASALTPGNCRSYLDDLPQDVDVVRIERAEPKVRRPHKYTVKVA